jgi:nitrogen fixation/metabolism regulation signal transduction histidine kinase
MSAAARKPKRRLAFDGRLLIRAALIGLPGLLVALPLLWTSEISRELRWVLTFLLVVLWWGMAHALHRRIVHLLHTLSNMLSAIRKGDFSLRAPGADRDDPHGAVMWEINALTRMHREQRLDELEAMALLREIMEEIDVAIFAFDARRKLRLVNRAGERLLARPLERVSGLAAEQLGLAECLEKEAPTVLDRTFPGGTGRWEVRRSEFRQGGMPMQLLVLSDVSRALREEERQAWQRLIRVLSHEMNNSLTPIRSIGGSLARLLEIEPGDRPPDWESDLRSGLGVIASRSESLIRFMNAYAELTRLPQPELRPIELGALVQRVLELETRMQIELEPGPDCTISADRAQIEQLLINLVRNGVDASLETGGRVEVGWTNNGAGVEIWVADEGPGLSTTSNLFVPFFTTKPGGSGIGLLLSRQIAEAHGGSLTLKNRTDQRGCEARLRLVY